MLIVSVCVCALIIIIYIFIMIITANYEYYNFNIIRSDVGGLYLLKITKQRNIKIHNFVIVWIFSLVVTVVVSFCIRSTPHLHSESA